MAIIIMPAAVPPAPSAAAAATQGFLASARKRASGHSTATFPATGVVMLPNIAPGCTSAILIVEAATGAAQGAVLARFWSDGLWPTALEGMPVYDGSVIEIIGYDDVINTHLISADGLAHKLNIQYFTGQ